MTSTWKKYGLIFEPNKKKYWQKTHAALPTPLWVKENIYRIYFTSRDSEQKTYVGYFDADFTEPSKPQIINISEEPVLKPGKIGCFDFDGVQCTSVVAKGDEIYMYYLGWTKGLPEPLFYTSIGLAISKDGGITFEKHNEAPIMERSEFDHWMVSGGTVIVEDKLWRMWYISGISFEFMDGIAKSFYNIKYAESENGIDWKRNGKVCFDLSKDETNISRPSIISEDGIYKAWYPYKKNNSAYRIGYAESKNGMDWIRKDELAGIDVSNEGWDSKSLDKQYVFKHGEVVIMLYNGNNFGFDGIGLAIQSK